MRRIRSFQSSRQQKLEHRKISSWFLVARLVGSTHLSGSLLEHTVLCKDNILLPLAPFPGLYTPVPRRLNKTTAASPPLQLYKL